MTQEWRTLTEITADQHGAAALWQLRAAGVSDTSVQNWVARGRLYQPHREVVVVQGSTPSWRQTVSVAVLTEGPDAVACRQTAAVLWGLPDFRPGIVHVLSPRGRRRRRRGIVVHESCALDPCDVDVVDGIRVTGLVRTLIDLAGCVHPYRVGQAYDHCRRNGLVLPGAVHERTEELARPGRNGITAIRGILAERPGGVVPHRSELERRFYRLLVDAGIPPPARNHRTVVGGEVFEIDLAWPAVRFGVEIDGAEWHLDLERFHHDRARWNRLQVAGGWRLAFYTARRLREPSSVIAEVRAALASVGAHSECSQPPKQQG